MIPFTYQAIIRQNLGRVKNVLDIGSGDGRFMQLINWDKKYHVTGVELFEPYVKKSKKTGLYEKILKQDIKKLNIENNAFDAVLSSQVVEHFTKKDGIAMIKNMEKWAKDVVLIGTPRGHFHQEPYDGNELQRHLSEWSVEDFEKLGFQVYGQGLKYVYGQGGLLESWMGRFLPTRLLLFGFSYLLSPITYFFPKQSTYLVAVKKK